MGTLRCPEFTHDHFLLHTLLDRTKYSVVPCRLHVPYCTSYEYDGVHLATEAQLASWLCCHITHNIVR